MRQESHILEAPQLGVELPQSDRRPNYSNTHVLRTCFAQQAAGVQQALVGVEVKFDAGHQIGESKFFQAFRNARALGLAGTPLTGGVDGFRSGRLDFATTDGLGAHASSVRY